MRAISAFVFAMILMTPSLAGAVSPPCSCLQQLLVNYPGPYDLYISLNKETSCSEEGEESMWYGTPSNSNFPQNCVGGGCETYQGDNQRAGIEIPGHGQEFIGIKAWDVLRVGLESARQTMPGLEFGLPSFHTIPRKSLPATVASTGDLVIMAVPMVFQGKGSRIDGRTYYLCIQIDSAGGLRPTNAIFEKCKAGYGSQLKVDYRVDGELRTGLLWLKD